MKIDNHNGINVYKIQQLQRQNVINRTNFTENSNFNYYNYAEIIANINKILVKNEGNITFKWTKHPIIFLLPSSSTKKSTGKFSEEKVNKINPKWKLYIKRESKIPKDPNNLRNNFELDYDLVTSSEYFRRLRKMQVYSPDANDHICTRGEHSMISSKIARHLAKAMGLNPSLAETIGLVHDIGHTPFGHEGENNIKEIMEKYNINNGIFSHQANGVRVVRLLATRQDEKGIYRNLNLTAAVIDGILCHSGKIPKDVGLYPRKNKLEFVSIEKYDDKREKDHENLLSASWEGLLMKFVDKISYVGRDIEDAIALGDLKENQYKELKKKAEEAYGQKLDSLNSSCLIHLFEKDLIENSSPQAGLRFSKEALDLMTTIRDYNFKHIYYPGNAKIHEDVKSCLTTIFETLKDCYDDKTNLPNLKHLKKTCPSLANTFGEFLEKYSNIDSPRKKIYGNKVIYFIRNDKDHPSKEQSKAVYYQAIIDFMTGMTDSYAIKTYKKIKPDERLISLIED